MKKLLLLLSLITTLLLPVSAFSGEGDPQQRIDATEIIVSATRLETEADKVASSVTVITRREIENTGKTSLVEILEGIPGIDIAQSGGAGSNTSVYMRGGNSNHTLVMIDGIQVNSPTTGGYDFANLTIDNIERIEVVRGPQGTLYGSDALTGLINIITKRGKKGEQEIEISAEAGSFNTFRESAGFSGGTDKAHYSIGVSRLDTEAISAASEKNGNTEKDGYANTTVSTRFGYRANENTDIDFTFRFSDARSDLDSFGADDPNFTRETTTLTGAAKFNQIISEIWSHQFTFSVYDERFKTKDPDTAANRSAIDTRIDTVNWQHNFYVMEEKNILSLGMEYEDQTGKNLSANIDNSIENRAVYFQDQLLLFDNNLNITTGIRRDESGIFGGETTYRTALSYLFGSTGTTIKGNWGTGFKSPSINDLYYDASWGKGNPDLQPERGTGYDLGIDQRLFDKTVLSATYFNNTIDNLIQWDWSMFPSPATPVNVAKAKTSGWEFALTTGLPFDLSINGSYTMLDARDEETDKELARRAKNKGNLAINWNPANINVNLALNYVGDRWSDTNNTEKLDSYKKVDLAVSYEVTKKIRVFGRIENVTDEEYEEVKDYSTPGISSFGGVKVSF